MALQTVWFALITVLWAGFFVLEGFDFGVGMLVPVLGRDDTDRRVLRATVAPVWDGNEVWLVVAGAAMFAAFPDWYATMFSAFYLPLFAVLLGLILRACAFEFRDKSTHLHWRRTWDWLMGVSSLLVPLLVGVAFGGLLGGLPIDGSMEFAGDFTDLVQPYALYSGLTFASLCLVQGFAFLRLKTADSLARAATRGVRVSASVCAVLVVGFVIWTQAVSDRGVIPGAGFWLALTFTVAAAILAWEKEHAGWVFACSSAAIAFTTIGFFATLHPNLMISSTGPANSITIADSSSSYTLTVMTVIAAVMVPVVVLYQAWTYWVFRQRVRRRDVGGAIEEAASTGTREDVSP
ncbi:MAG: cytochrome d ubiquinol oxidase subunit II [Acidimicrobiia bacterium]|nr:cytochrome d ubiquinol oxidase subunit II [Acidimicrobiia bacterium]